MTHVRSDEQASWYAAVDGHQFGPWSLDQVLSELKQGRITDNSLIWTAGMGAWTPARDVAEVREAALRARIIPPPIPPAVPPAAAPPPIPDTMHSSPSVRALTVAIAETETPAPPRDITGHRVSTAWHQPEGVLPSGSAKVHPWRRWFARMLDYFLMSVVLGILVTVFSPSSDLLHNDYALQFIALALFVPVEALFIAHNGATPGKALLNITVCRAGTGQRLGLGESFRRAVAVWIHGAALGIPIVSFGTALHQYSTLSKHGATTYDKDGQYEQRHGPMAGGRLALLFLVIGGIVLLVIIGSAK